MIDDIDRKLTCNFSLYELLRSDTAERRRSLLEEQLNPPESVVNNLTYLAQTALQPIREILNYPIRVTSGYRSKGLNKAVGGSARSQHVRGEAADLTINDSFLSDENTKEVRKSICQKVRELTGSELRPDVNANFYLFAYICLHLDDLDVDQIIHEYGIARGRPAWVHISASANKDRRQIVAIGKRYSTERGMTLERALSFGT